MWKKFLLEIASLSLSLVAEVLSRASQSKTKSVTDPISSDKGNMPEIVNDLPSDKQAQTNTTIIKSTEVK